MSNLVLEMHFDCAYSIHTKQWRPIYKRVPVLIEKDYNPFINHGVIDANFSYRHPELPISCMDLEDRLIMMTDEEYDRYLYLKTIKCPRSPKKRKY